MQITSCRISYRMDLRGSIRIPHTHLYIVTVRTDDCLVCF